LGSAPRVQLRREVLGIRLKLSVSDSGERGEAGNALFWADEAAGVLETLEQLLDLLVSLPGSPFSVLLDGVK